MSTAFAYFCAVTVASAGACEEHNAVSKRRFRARVAYDGTLYSGWQFQSNQPTVQAELEKAISRKFGVQVRAVGASRTDSGVHARGQAVHFDVPLLEAERKAADLQKFEFTLNHMLPRDIRVINVGVAPNLPLRESVKEAQRGRYSDEQLAAMLPWHSIYCSAGKLYTYRFSTRAVVDPMERLYRYHEWRASRFGFSEELLREAASKFVGIHDFSAFTNTTLPPQGIEPPVLVNPIRTIRSADVIKEDEGMYRIEFRIDGAMYRMIRNVMGTILDAACEKLDPSSIEHLFASRDRRLVPKSAPAHGLCLEEVFYKDWAL